MEKLYLSQNVMVEPLINQWYAWPYLVPPVTCSMYIANLHVKTMQSFLAAPQAHIAALKNPAMAGGPFIHYDESRVGEVKSLLDRTMKEQAHMLKLAAAIKELDEILSNEAVGYSLEPIYKRVPDVLKGYVELVYDLNNRPSFRLIEGLIYKSSYYRRTSQTVALSLINDDSRVFAFSSPKLEDEGWLHLSAPFDHEGIDELFKMKNTPQSLDYIEEALGVEARDSKRFSTFFTAQSPPRPTRYEGEGVRLRYFGHACVLIESKEVSILIDPVISYENKAGIPRYIYADLPERLDYVLITHNHQDHCVFEALLQLRHKIRNVIVPKCLGGNLADPCLKAIFQNIGFTSVIEIDEMESIEIDGGSIIGVPFLGEHGDLNIRTKIAHLVQVAGKSILLAADSNNIETKLYEHIYEFVGNVDVIFLGMECVGGPMTWLYGPLLTKPLSRKMDQSRRFDGSNCERALELITQINPGQVYIYAMGQEPWLTFLTALQYTEDSQQLVESNRLINISKNRSLIAERLFGQKEIFLN